MWILSYISQTSMSIAHETMPCIGKLFWKFFFSIFFEKITDLIVCFFWIMSHWIIGFIMRDKRVRSTHTYQTLFLITKPRCTTSNIKILFRFPILWQCFWKITDSTSLLMWSIKSRHISYETMDIFMKYLFSFARIRPTKINDMKMRKAIRTQDDITTTNSKISRPYFT